MPSALRIESQTSVTLAPEQHQSYNSGTSYRKFLVAAGLAAALLTGCDGSHEEYNDSMSQASPTQEEELTSPSQTPTPSQTESAIPATAADDEPAEAKRPKQERAQLGHVGPASVIVETALKAAGCTTGVVDKNFDFVSAGSLVAFQTNSGLEADGIAGPVTLKELKAYTGSTCGKTSSATTGTTRPPLTNNNEVNCMLLLPDGTLPTPCTPNQENAGELLGCVDLDGALRLLCNTNNPNQT